MSGADLDAGNTRPFQSGETLTYQLVWNYIPVGHSTLSVKDFSKVNGEKAWHFQMLVRSNDFADTFYKVRNSIDAYARKDLTSSLQYNFDQKQGRTVENLRLTYDPGNARIKTVKDATDKGWVNMPHPCVDPLTMLFIVRAFDITEVGQVIPIWVSDGETHIKCKVNVVKKEMIKINDVEREAFLVEPDLRGLNSVFQRSQGAKLKVWVSNDKYKIPLKVASRVIIGSFEARLTGFETGGGNGKVLTAEK